MKYVVVIPNPKKDKGLTVTKKLMDALLSFGFIPFVERSFSVGYGISDNIDFYDAFPKNADLIIVIGGDGSVIEASRLAIDHDIPILGVNLGKVGYLSEVEPDNLSVLAELAAGNYHTEEKMLLAVESKNGASVTVSDRLAVNDVVISHNDFLGISDFKVENSHGDCVKYRADGIIVSTPAGSTAYSLSAGGPIISHGVEAVIVTPVCPHSFFNRSIIFDKDEKITVTNIGDGDLNISVDGRCFAVLRKGDCCSIGRASRSVKMITFSKDNMFSTLFRKMRILEDIK